MKQTIIHFIAVFATIFLIACGQTVNKTVESSFVVETGKLISIDFSDTNYMDVRPYAKDTLTRSGWSIKYKVKDDSTKYNDIYIECSNGSKKGLFHGEDILLMRRYFIPDYIGETNSHIYFTHGCSTECAALLVFSKDTTTQFNDYVNIIDYNIELGQVLYVTDSCYENEDKIYDLELIDFSKNKTHKITYNNICSSYYKPSCIDTVIFGKKDVMIKSTLSQNIGSEKEIKQTKTIKL